MCIVTQDTRIEWIGALLALNFSLFPILPRDKKPAIRWKRYQDNHPTSDELQEWFKHSAHYNIGVVTGVISLLVVVDTDTDEGEHGVRDDLPETPFMVKTAKGFHRYYRHPGGTVRNKARIREGVDIRADGGYVLGPGSVHPSGITYQPIRYLPKSLDALPVFDLAWIESKKSHARTTTHLPSRRRSESMDPTRPVQRARDYLAKVPPAIEGQAGDTRTFTVVCRIVRGFDLTDVEALDVLTNWNATCVPPWSENELEEKIRNARKYGTEPLAAELGRQTAPRHSPPTEGRYMATASVAKTTSRNKSLRKYAPDELERTYEDAVACGTKLFKTLIVEALCRVPSWQRQDQLARIVRWAWPGFTHA